MASGDIAQLYKISWAPKNVSPGSLATSKPGINFRILIDIEGPNELVQHFAYSGSSHQRKSAARHIPDMVWLHPTSSGEEGDIAQAVPIDKQKCGVLYGTVKNLCLGSRVCTR